MLKVRSDSIEFYLMATAAHFTYRTRSAPIFS